MVAVANAVDFVKARPIFADNCPNNRSICQSRVLSFSCLCNLLFDGEMCLPTNTYNQTWFLLRVNYYKAYW